MKKIAVTGFLPFGGRDVNPAQLIVEALQAPAGAVLVKCILPVEYGRATEELTRLLRREKPDVLLSLGQAGNVPHLSIERVAVNLDNSQSSDGKHLLPDQAGDAPVDRPIVPDGPAAYFATLPVWELVEAVNGAGVPARISYSAGTFLCNHVMYLGCHLAAELGEMRSGFIHVPFLPEQLSGGNGYSMAFAEMLKGVQAAVDHLAEH